MKLSSIEPFVGTPEVDIERELAAKEVSSKAEKVAPIGEEEKAGTNVRHATSSEVRQGVTRLADFLKSVKNRAPKDTAKSRVKKAIRSYGYLDRKEDEEMSLGAHYDEAV